jgi:hypothetical protein
MRYRIPAADEADAIIKLLDGEAEPVEQSQDSELAENYGLPAADHRELAGALREQGVPVDAVIPSITSIEIAGYNGSL